MITSCSHVDLTDFHQTVRGDREVRTSMDIHRTRRKRSCGHRGEHRGERETEALEKRKYWTEKLCCCCISGRFWVGVCNQNALMYITLHFIDLSNYICLVVVFVFFLIGLPESNDSPGSTAVQKARGFYHSCLDTKSIETAGAEPFLTLIQKVR